MTSVFLKKHRKAVVNPGISEKRMTQMYGELFGPAMGKSFERMSEKSVRNIVAACSDCAFYRYSAEVERHLHFEYGSKDFDLKGAKIIRVGSGKNGKGLLFPSIFSAGLCCSAPLQALSAQA